MISDDKELLVKNRSAGKVVYNIPNLGIRREFEPNEQMRLTYKELKALTFVRGGRKLMANFLLITDPDADDPINENLDPEYYYGEKEITEIMLNGSLDEFLDMLDFAPIGVIDMIKDLAIKLPLNDVTKREALRNKTGFDTTAAIENMKDEDGEVQFGEEQKTRRVKKKAKTEESTVEKKPRRTKGKKAELTEEVTTVEE